MKNLHLKKILRSSVSIFAAVSLLMGTVPAVFAAEGEEVQTDSAITLLDDLQVNYQDYVNSDVMFQMPEGMTADEEVSVIIRYDMPALMDAYEGTDKTMSMQEFAQTDEAADVIAAIDARREAILDTLDEQGVEYKLGEQYNALFAGFELLIKGGDYAVTCMSMADDEQVVLGNEYLPQEAQLVENEVNVYETGIFNASDVPYDGTGMVVAVLDTGLDSNHTAFSTDNFTSDKLGMTYDDVAGLLKKTKAYEWADGGLSVDDVYINEKVPFGYDYADNDPDVYSTHNNHGTHVSGVIVGKDDTITGVAPNAQLVSMKIFSDVEDSAMSSWILAALEDCVILGVDVINMSLGTACGFGHETEEELLDGVYSRLRDAGIAVVVAASNSYNSAYGSEANGNLPLTSNPDTATVGSPGTYPGTMSVASVNGVETPYITFDGQIIYFDEANDNGGKEKDFFETLLGDKESMTVEFVKVPGVGRSADYTGLDVKGKIALVRRGSNTFEEKALIAEAQGAIGIIIYNNVSGDIKMNIGDATLAVCSIAQDDGELLAAAGTGTITIDKSQTSGPFMSDFSSWGPTPSLGIKPEITAHGGNILSSVTGGGYDRLSGTSMACPNIAGATVLMHQYVVENFPEIADNTKAVTALVNRLMMSTADVIINTNGKPYAVRKQGAGLANLYSATNTPAAIMTYDKDGNEMDTAKLELGDDPNKTGVYEMTFAVDNFGDKNLTYKLSAHVLTEGVSDTKTNAGKTTVTEQAVELEGAKVEVVSVENGTRRGNRVTVKAGEQAKVTVKITLSDEDKAYLDQSFENGMYVEGFIQLNAIIGTDIDLSVPYLAFYGDWTQAPMFDLEYYDTNADELDDGIDPEDKLMADSFASRAIGGISADYVSYLGSYYFVQDPKDMVISASRDYIALSNQEGAISSLRFVWAGMLRAANSIDITITDDATGKVIFETVEKDVRKSYGDGGTIRPSNIEIEFNMKEYNLPNNSKLTVKLVGHMDYGEDGIGANRNYTMEFPMTVDFEAPTVSDVEYYYEYDKTAKKNRLYAKLAVYDNHYAMSGQVGYVVMSKDENDNDAPELMAFEQYMTPIYSKENSTTYVTLELTDYVYQIKDYAMNKNSFVFTCYDYCLNYASYEIRLPDSFEDFYFEGLDEGLSLSPNEVFTLEPYVTPDTAWGELLEFKSSKPSVVRVVNNKLVAVKEGKAIIRVDDPNSDKKYSFTVNVLGEDDEGYRRYDQSVADMFILTGYKTQKAYYILDNEEKDIGDTGDTRFFEGNYNLSLYPSESVALMYDLDPFYPRDTTLEYESSNENIVKVTAAGVVTAVAEGFASVTVKVLLDGKSTYYSESVSVEVKDPYDVTGGILNHYYGLGGLVEIPTRLKLKEIGSFAFANFDYVEKTEEELARDDRESTKQWYIGDATVTKVVIPEGVEKISAYAFANLTALEEVVLPSTLTAIEYGAFVNCTALKKITFSGENNVQIINQHAFEACDLEGKLEWPSACVISDYAFAGNKDIQEVVTGDSLLSIGQYAFAGCESIESVTITAELVKYGTYAFTGCEKLKKFYVNATVLPEGMFYQCEEMTEVTIGPDVNDIGEFAFLETGITTIEVKSGNKAYKSGKNPYVLSSSGKTLVAVAPTIKGKVNADTFGGGKITEIAGGAFSHNKAVQEVTLPEVTEVGDYAFGSSKALEKVTLGELTHIGEYAFFETAISKLPAFTAKTEIGRYAFAFTNITTVTIPDKMEVAEGVFSECAKLKKVVIGDDVTLGKYAFGMNKDSVFKVERKDIGDTRYFYYVFHTNLKSVTIGKNADIGETAFTNHASLEKVTLGEGAKLGKMAFYNNASLKEIDLSGVTELGDYALSGDVYYMCLDDQMTVAAVDKTGHYMYTYHAPLIRSADLSSAKSIGEYAFAYCRDMVSVKLGDQIDEIKPYTFAGCESLKKINLEGVKTVGDYAFSECASLKKVDLSAAETIGEFAFVYNRKLAEVTFNPKGATTGEGAFSYCDVLKKLNNMANLTEVGDYAFAYSGLTSADLTDAKKIGSHAFMKEKYTAFTVTLGKDLETLGDNPFAMCVLTPFSSTEERKEGGKTVTETVTTYDVSKDVTVVDGSLYCKVPNGLELITYLGTDHLNADVAEDTVRVSAMAFTGSKVKLVTLPATVAAIGHKAFYDCDSLEMVVFNSFNAPILEEEYDPSYYESYTHMPGAGDYGTYKDYDGNEVAIIGEGIVPYFMWNATGGMYSNVFYGANFKNYVGYVKDKVAMIRPTNGVGYDTYIYNHYFNMQLDGTIAADATTMAAIKAIKALPAKVTDEHRDLVKAARAAYDKIATVLQQGLVHNYADLVTAEQRLAAQDKADAPEEQTAPEQNNGWVLWLVIGLLLAGLLAVVGWMLWMIKKGKLAPEDITNWFKAFPGKFVAFWKAFPGNFIKVCKATPGFFKALPGNLKRFALWLWAVLKKAWNWVKPYLLIAVTFIVTLYNKVAPAVGGFFKKLFPGKKKAQPAEETPVEEAPEVSAEEAPAEAPAQETVAEIPEMALNEAIPPVIVETPAEAPAAEPAAEEIPVEETVVTEAPKKVRKPFPWRVIGLILLAVVGVAAVAALVLALLNMKGDPTPYEQNDLDNYTVSVRFDANGGEFTTGVSVITDAYTLEGLQTGADGKVSIPLRAPDHESRGKEKFTATKSGQMLVGWYANRTASGTDADGNTTYTYSEPWDFETSRLSLDAAGTYTATEPQVTLYAVWAPQLTVEFYSVDNLNEVLGTHVMTEVGGSITVPAWDKETGAMEMHDFPKRNDYTFEKAYLDAAGTQPVDAETLTHPGQVDLASGTVTDGVLKVYIQWKAGNWYHIYNAEQFVDNASVNGSYVLHADLDFSEENWPTSLMYGNFTGTILGNGHTIRNVKLAQTNNSKVNAGLFGSLADTAVIRDLTLSNVTFTIEKGTRMAGTSYGLLCGTLSGKATLEGLTITDSHLQIDSGAYFATDDYVIGLLCGSGKPGAIDLSGIDCTVVGDQPDTYKVQVTENTVTLEEKD